MGRQPHVGSSPTHKTLGDGRGFLNSNSFVYRQIIDQILGAIASETLADGDQLPTVRQLAVDLSVNPNTVIRAYRELEIRGIITTHQGTGTFIAHKQIEQDEVERQRRLSQLVGQFVSRAGSEGFSVKEAVDCLQDLVPGQPKGGKDRVSAKP